ncbi:YkvA family protein [Streptomyces sp. NPDC020681]|uniref:YkvA family protein n=1 Tax=Streptomyces sp. NPDC020681 TaxID=3365083 RepID=UPI003795D70E
MSTELWWVAAVAAALIATTAALAVALLVRLVRARRRLRDAGIPVENKVAFWGALIYLASPVDLLPDPVLLDDIGVLLLALRSLHSAAARAGVAQESQSV